MFFLHSSKYLYFSTYEHFDDASVMSTGKVDNNYTALFVSAVAKIVSLDYSVASIVSAPLTGAYDMT